MIRVFTIVLFTFYLLSTSSAAYSSEILFGKEPSNLVKVYPNPMTTEAAVKIDPSVDIESGKVSFVIYNIVGKEVFRINNIKTKELKIVNEDFLPGLYFFQLSESGKTLSTGRISVN